MEADERPQKIRKLSHSLETNDQNVHAIEENPAYDNKYDQAQQQQQQHQHQYNVQVNAGAASTNPSAQHNELDLSKASSSTLDASSAVPEPSKPLSKNQLKKLRKQQEWDAGRDERRVKRKEKTKERRQRKREQRDQEAEDLKASGGNPVPQSKPQRTRHVRLPVTFLIDCGFDDKMVEKERISLASQLTRSYSDNHKAPYQAHLVVSSWGGELKKRFDTVLHEQHVNWKGIRFTEEDFVDAAATAEKDMSGPKSGKLAGVFQQYSNTTTPKVPQQRSKDDDDNNTAVAASIIDTAPTNGSEKAEPEIRNTTIQSADPSSAATSNNISTSTPPLPPREIIYLTSDSPHTLTSLSPYSTYIIGGLVDKNRHKGICYRTATERNVKTAKLPIGELMEMQSRFVLATNHVVEIMIRWLECGDWGEAFMRVIPKRKGGRLRASGGRGGTSIGTGEGGGDEDDDGQGRDGGFEFESEEENEDADEDVHLDDVVPEAGHEAEKEHSSMLKVTNSAVTDIS